MKFYRFIFIALSLLCLNSGWARDIKIGQSLDLSGISNVGRDFSNGLRTYFDAVNARGGLQGRRIDFIQLNDNGAPEQTATNIATLLQENQVDLLISPTSEETLRALTQVTALTRQRIAIVGAAVGQTAQLTNVRFLPIRASFDEEATLLLQYIAMFNGGDIALIKGEGPDAESSYNATLKAMERLKFRTRFAGTSGEWLSYAQSQHSLATIILTGDAIAVTPSIKHARKLSPYARLYGFSTIDYRTLIEMAGESARGMMISQVVPPPSKTVYEFQREHHQLMLQYRDESPSLHSLEGYIVARTIVAALEPLRGDLSPAQIELALRNLNPQDFGPMRVTVNTRQKRYVNLTAIAKTGALID